MAGGRIPRGLGGGGPQPGDVLFQGGDLPVAFAQGLTAGSLGSPARCPFVVERIFQGGDLAAEIAPRRSHEMRDHVDFAEDPGADRQGDVAQGHDCIEGGGELSGVAHLGPQCDLFVLAFGAREFPQGAAEAGIQDLVNGAGLARVLGTGFDEIAVYVVVARGGVDIQPKPLRDIEQVVMPETGPDDGAMGIVGEVPQHEPALGGLRAGTGGRTSVAYLSSFHLSAHRQRHGEGP